MSDFITRISTTDGAIVDHYVTDDEMVHLLQIIDLDGRESVVESESDILNGSGRECGTHLVVDPEAWAFVQESLNSVEVG